MQKKVIVLGCGLIGKAIAIDLSSRYYVTAVDKDKNSLEMLRNKHLINTIQADVLVDGKVEELIAEFDLVVLALPGFIAYSVLERIISAGKNVVDISFFPENPLQLDELAKSKGVTAVVDCGVAPGVGNIILGYHASQEDIISYKCVVGGLPFQRDLPFQYKAPFSPVDVLEEYTRPARIVQNGNLVIKEALSDIELLNFDNVGTLEAFNTDGLRTLINTMNVPNMVEKTIRYPGHADLIKIIKSMGFLSDKLISVNSIELTPLEFTSKLLIDAWELKPEDREFTVMRVNLIARDVLDNKTEYLYELYDAYDEETNTSSMARTTGYTANAVVNLVLDGKITNTGILPPELLGKDKYVFDYILQYLSDRNVIYKKYEIKDE